MPGKIEKKCEYGVCVLTVKCGSFTPLAFSTFGGRGLSKEAIFYNHLADLLAHKHGTSYNLLHMYRFIIPSISTTSYQQSFFPKTIKQWNSLTNDQININSPKLFVDSLIDTLTM